MVPSGPPVASVWPSGLVDCHSTRPACPAKARLAGFHVLVDHSLAQPFQLSGDDEASIGGEAREVRDRRGPRQRGEVPVRSRVEDLDAPFVGVLAIDRHGDGERPAGGAERYVLDRQEAQWAPDGLAGGQCPQPDDAAGAVVVVVARGGHQVSVGAEAGREDLVVVVGAVAPDDVPAQGVEEGDVTRGVADDEQPALRHEPHAGNGPGAHHPQRRRARQRAGVDQGDRADALGAMAADIAENIIGMDPAEPGTIWAKIWKDLLFLGRRGAALMAASAVDCAVWDIHGKLRDEPLWASLGGERRSFDCYASDRLWLPTEGEELAAEARELERAGFPAIKLRVGSSDLDRDERRLATVRDVVADGTEVIIDANHGWSVEQAVDAAQRFEAYRVRWFEEPVDPDDYDGTAAVARAGTIPVAAGESWYSREENDRALELNAISILMPDLARIGGISPWLDSVATASERGVLVSPHLFPEIHIHLLGGVSTPGPLEYVPWNAGLFATPLEPVGGVLCASDRPGLGLEFKSTVFP
jgi:L-alanine-DL-glutamate epimerase-like enolase superfamily enzyme